MTRINTNISAIIGLNNLNTAQDQLQTSLTRLSTGLRINSAADDPSGMIANNEFQSDIASSNQAISNSQQDQQMLSTADSALSQISSLLDTIRGLVTQAANTATMTPDEIEANQQQVNASLTAINQIAGTTTFGNQELLNGSLNFNTQGVNSSQISGLMVNQASLGTGQQNVNVQVLKQATQAALNYNGTTLSNAANLEITGAAGSQTVQLGAGSTLQQMADSINAATGGTGVQAVVNQQTAQTATAGTTTMLNVGGQDGFAVTSMGTGQTQGAFTIQYYTQTNAATLPLVTAPVVAMDATNPNQIDITLTTQKEAKAAAPTTAVQIGAAATDSISLAAQLNGSHYNNAKLLLVNGGSAYATPTVSYDYNSNTITATIDAGTTTVANIATAINGDAELSQIFTATGTSTVAAVVSPVAYSGLTNNAGADGQVVTTIGQLVTAFKASGISYNIAATPTTNLNAAVSMIANSATVGQFNSAAGAGQPNNAIQLTGTSTASGNQIQFVAGGANQALSVSTTPNAITGGYSTAYIEGTTTAPGLLEVQSVLQGSQYDGITVKVGTLGTDNAVYYDAGTKTLTIDAKNADASAQDLANSVNNSPYSALFKATSIVAGSTANTTAAFTAATDKATTQNGALYDGITVNLATDANGNVTSTAADVINAINNSASLQALGITASNAGASDGSGIASMGTATLTQAGATAANADASGTSFNAKTGATAEIAVTANNAGAAYNGVEINFVADQKATGTEYASYDSTSKILTFHIASGDTAANVVKYANQNSSQSVLNLFTIALPTGSAGGGTVTANDMGWLTGGVTYSGGSGAVAGQGNFDAGQVVGATGLTLQSTGYGSSQSVSVNTLTGSFATYNAANVAATQANGTDAGVQINGVNGVANGLNVSLGTGNLGLSFNLNSGVTAGSNFNFQITGGGAVPTGGQHRQQRTSQPRHRQHEHGQPRRHERNAL